MSKPVFILNGPNLNLLGRRESSIYGITTLADIEAQCAEACGAAGLEMMFAQTNSEGGLVELIHKGMDEASGIIINAGAYTHTSLAVADALRALSVPVIEIHLSNVFAREAYRHHSYISPAAVGVICGFGPQSYTLAITAMAAQL